jgi:hypothetical protein
MDIGRHRRGTEAAHFRAGRHSAGCLKRKKLRVEIVIEKITTFRKNRTNTD